MIRRASRAVPRAQSRENAQRADHRGGTQAFFERVIVLVGSVPVACVAASVVAAAYGYAIGVGFRNGLFGEPSPWEGDE